MKKKLDILVATLQTKYKTSNQLSERNRRKNPIGQRPTTTGNKYEKMGQKYSSHWIQSIVLDWAIQILFAIIAISRERKQV